MHSSIQGTRLDQNKDPIILLIEDNVELLAILETIFQQHGFQVQAAASAERALPYLLKQLPHVIVCDIMLPGKSGYDLNRELRRNPDWYDIPFVFLSALSRDDEVCRGKLSGCDDYVTKPFDPDELIATVRGRVSLADQRRRMEAVKLEGFRKRILSTLSHEFRTPLVSIKAGAELLAEAEPLKDPELVTLIDAIRRGGERLEQLVNNFLLLQQIDFGQASQASSRFRRKMSPLVLSEMALDSLKNRPQAKSIELLNWIGEDTSRNLIQVYDVHVVHALQHILSNALKFGADHGPIHFSLATDADKFIFTIRDFGPGLSAEDRKRVCEAFRQIDREYNEQQGAGLGLTVAKYFIEMNGGELRFLDPADGRGLEVSIQFPIVTEGQSNLN